QALAVIGERASVGLLERVSDIAGDEVRKALRRMQVSGLLVERAEGSELAYEFKHAITQAVAYDTLLKEKRCALHRLIMEALSETTHYEVLARHAVLGEA